MTKEKIIKLIETKEKESWNELTELRKTINRTPDLETINKLKNQEYIWYSYYSLLNEIEKGGK